MLIPRLIIISVILVFALPVQADPGQTLEVTTHLQREGAALRLEIKGGPDDLLWNLEPAPVRAPGYQVRVQGAEGELKPVEFPRGELYRGYSADGRGGLAILHIEGDRCRGSLEIGPDRKTWEIRPVSGGPGHLLARTADETKAGASCALDQFEEETAAAFAPHSAKDRSQLPVQVVKLACDADALFFAQNGSDPVATAADIEMIIAGINPWYERDMRITFRITEIIIREAEPDPYTYTDPTLLLYQFSQHWQNNHSDVERDLAHLFTGLDMDGSAVGVAHANGGICNIYYGYSVVQSRYTTELDRRLAISAHEIGHNFDANHCDYTDAWCRIMCTNLGSCSGGIHSFGPVSLDRMGGYRDELDCLETLDVDVTRTELPFFDDFSASGDVNPALWTAADQHLRISGRLELEHGDTYSVQELGTIRTHFMSMPGAGEVSFQWRTRGVPAGQLLKVEYFDSDTWQWVSLADLVSPGIDSVYATETLATPASAAGDFFALRFSAWGYSGDYNDEWHLDNVSITSDTSPVPDLPPAGVERPLISGLAPNPFNPRTTVMLDVDRPGPVTVEVRDLQGKLVKTLLNQHLAAGAHDLIWEGKDHSGQPAASGMYLVHVKAGQRSESRKALLLK
jgi:hypothetical protein